MLAKNTLRGRDLMTEMDLSRDEAETILDVAMDLKRDFLLGRPTDLLRSKTLFMIMFNPSLRTRNSFEAGMTQLGGHAHYLEPGKIYTPALEGDEVAYGTERVSDVARVLNGIGHGIALRVFGAPVNFIYGKGHAIGREFCQWADIPVFNMGDDRFHPTQALANMLMVRELFGGFRGVKYHDVLRLLPERQAADGGDPQFDRARDAHGHGRHAVLPRRARRGAGGRTTLPRERRAPRGQLPDRP